MNRSQIFEITFYNNQYISFESKCKIIGYKFSFIYFNVTRSIPSDFLNSFAAYGYNSFWQVNKIQDLFFLAIDSISCFIALKQNVELFPLVACESELHIILGPTLKFDSQRYITYHQELLVFLSSMIFLILLPQHFAKFEQFNLNLFFMSTNCCTCLHNSSFSMSRRLCLRFGLSSSDPPR